MKLEELASNWRNSQLELAEAVAELAIKRENLKKAMEKLEAEYAPEIVNLERKEQKAREQFALAAMPPGFDDNIEYHVWCGDTLYKIVDHEEEGIDVTVKYVRKEAM